MSPYQPGTVSATLPAIIIVFNLNDVASLEHTKFVGVLTYMGALGREGSKRRKGGGGQGMVRKEKHIEEQRITEHVSGSGRSLPTSSLAVPRLWQAVASGCTQGERPFQRASLPCGFQEGPECECARGGTSQLGEGTLRI